MADREALASAVRLRDRIIGHLQAAGTDSISGIARAVSADLERPVHRLTVAGYLSALADAGELRELDRPPSKHYQLTKHRTEWSIHQRVGRVVLELGLPPPLQVPATVAALVQVLDRPVFRSEVRHAGLDVADDRLAVVEVDEVTRRQYRDLLRRRARPRIDLPRGDPLYDVAPGAVPDRIVQEVLRRVLLRASHAEHLAAPPRDDAVQARLQVEAPP